MKSLLTVFLAIVVSITGKQAFSESVSKSSAYLVARNFLARSGYPGILKSSTETGLVCEEYGKLQSSTGVPSESPAMYIFNFDPSGFIIVSGEDGVHPVMAYSRENNFETDHMHPVLVALLNGYEEAVNHRIKNNLPTSVEVKEEWTTYLNDDLALKSSSVADTVGPLATTKWGYLWPYNKYCPADPRASPSVGGHCPPGCGAVAMAQLMKYWNWPQTGVGCNSDWAWDYGYLFIDFGRTRYEWDNMPDALDSNSTETQINAVATLMYHCGVSVDMTYEPGESSSTFKIDKDFPNVNCVQLAFSKYFRYKKTIQSFFSSNPDTSWNSIIKKEIVAKRPVLCEAWSGRIGHNFIFDGFDSIGRLHVNWGWSGGNNGFYWIDSLKPFGNLNFDSDLCILTGIEPDTTAVDMICKSDNSGLSESLRIWPNPATDRLSVDLYCAMDDVNDVEILNSRGMKIMSVSYSCKPLQIPLDKLTAGVYFIRVKNREKYFTEKFIVEE